MSVLFDIVTIQIVASITKFIIDICSNEYDETEQILWYNPYTYNFQYRSRY